MRTTGQPDLAPGLAITHCRKASRDLIFVHGASVENKFLMDKLDQRAEGNQKITVSA